VNLADSHCHLDDSQFAKDREAVMERAQAAGLRYMLSIGTGEGPPDLAAAVRLADRWPCVYATVGVHPNDAAKKNETTFSDLVALLAHAKVRAIGEIGLDYHWGVPKETQIPVFTEQLSLAATNRMPVVIHTRDAWNDTLEILRSEWASTGLPCVMHCFTGDDRQARECLDLGFYLAFGGVTTFPKSDTVRDAARITPLDRLLLETDAPYLAPVPRRGKRNEPAFVAYTAKAVADLRGIEMDELAEATTRNFERVFAIRANQERPSHPLKTN
jgi:TatD DNase family protein